MIVKVPELLYVTNCLCSLMNAISNERLLKPLRRIAGSSLGDHTRSVLPAAAPGRTGRSRWR